MRNIFVILKKELKRFFTDKRMLLSLFLPGVMIFLVYSLMGDIIGDSFTSDDEHVYSVYVVNPVDEFKAFNESKDYKIEIKDDFEETIDEVKGKIKEGIVDLLIVYEQDFYSKLESGNKPSLEMFYDSTSPESSEIFNYYYTVFFATSTTIEFSYFINKDASINYDLATTEDVSKMFLTMMMPFLLVILLFSGCMAVSTESIAGEKERGTIATLLVTPTKRSHIALGKILALSIVASISSVVSFIGLIASLPKLIQGDAEITLQMYGFGSYVSILLVMLFTVILFTTILSLVSTFAKSVKEATQYAVPFMVLTMIIGITSLMSSGQVQSSWYLYLIPVYNSVQCLSGVFSLSFNAVNFIITIIANIAYILIGIFALTKMFNSEKVVFNK